LADGLTEEGTRIPLVVIALDSSGSMEYEDQATGIVPSCPDGGPYRRNRWAIALEVLTGQFSDFTCQVDLRTSPLDHEDYAYPVPHVVYTPTVQVPNGLIDLHADVVRFAYMSFDTEFGAEETKEGGWSFQTPRNHPLLGPINLGGKNLYATATNESYTGGAFVPFFGADGPPSALRAANLLLEETIRDTIPYGGTPIAPMLEDIREFMLSDTTLAPFNSGAGTGDPFYECRPRFTILITDGLPTQGEGEQEGYTTSPQAASDLYASHPLGMKTYVIGFALDDGTIPSELEALAQAGNPECTPPCAYLANNQTELVLALSQIIGEILTGRFSRTTAVNTNITRTTLDAQYQFNTGWGSVPVNTIDRQGFLDQAIYRCTEACRTDTGGAGICDILALHDSVNNQTNPAPVYLVQDTNFTLLAATNPDVTPDTLGVPNQGTTANPAEPPVALLDLQPLEGAELRQILGTVTLGNSNDETVTETYKQQLVNLILAAPGSRREGYRMGAVRYGTPALLERPATGISQRPSFAEYQDRQRARPTVLFTPTHTGELMAMRVDRASEQSEANVGRHLWSVIPNSVVKRLQEHATQTVFLLDGAPVVRDVLLSRGAADEDAVQESRLWRAVLVQSFRDGGRGYFALDVTDPTEPEFLWEINSERRCTMGPGPSGCFLNDNDEADDFCHLGFSMSQPATGNVYLDSATYPAQERAVVVFGGGRFEESDDIDEATTCGTSTTFNEANVARRFFVVDAQSGAKLAEFGLGRGNVAPDDEAFLLYDFVGSPSCFNTGADALLTRCFIGDEGGQLWRIDLTSSNPESWVMTRFFDPYTEAGLEGQTRGPLYHPPALAQDDLTGRLIVTFGTGNVDSTVSLSAAHGVFSLTETLTLDSSGVANPEVAVKATPYWQLIFTDGTMIMGSPLVYDQVTYFTTYRVDPDEACTIAPDAARLYGLHYRNATGAAPGVIGSPVGSLVPDLTQPDVKEFFTALPPGVPSGVQIITRPTCVGDEALTFDPILGAGSSTGTEAEDGKTPSNGAGAALGGGGGGPGQVELVVQYQGAGAEAPATGTTTATVETQTLQLQRPRSAVVALDWALVYD
jgi:type IV pilus assembly protein PilY1